MSRIKIKNFGPIKEGFIENDGWMEIKKVTAFIGNNGSGKSTAAKLISIFTWLEKTLVRNKNIANQLSDEIFRNFCLQHDISEYFSGNTQISFEGNVFRFDYDEKSRSFTSENISTGKDYIMPKIQYVSAARNLLTILYSISQQSFMDAKGNLVDMSANIPFMVRDLNKEYIMALSSLAKEGFSLPINETKVFFNDHQTYIEAQGKRVSMSSASSGIQSITPLLIVSSYLSNEVKKEPFNKVQQIDTNLKNTIISELAKQNEKIVEKFNLYCSFGKNVIESDDVLRIETVLKRFVNSSFVNIVEEPEQNLFPTSQQNVLNSLLECNNAVKENKLVISTHSPYILSALNNAILAADVFKLTGKEIESYKIERRVSFENISAYKYENGHIFSIKDEETRLINADAIDSCSTKINSDFDELLDLLPENDN